MLKGFSQASFICSSEPYSFFSRRENEFFNYEDYEDMEYYLFTGTRELTGNGGHGNGNKKSLKTELCFDSCTDA